MNASLLIRLVRLNFAPMLLFAFAFGCRSAMEPAQTPTSVGINPATLIDPNAEADLTHLGQWEDLYRIGEQIKMSRRPPVLPPKRTILALSGGGMYGAFTAGVLYGWSEAGNRPAFDVITGVSTGSLIAALLFAGPEYDPLLKQMYTETKTSDIYTRRGIHRIIFADALADNTPLAQQIERSTPPEYFQRVIAEHRKGRRLYIGTTDIDGRRQVIWDMGAIAVRNTPESVDLYRKVLLASSAIPGFFPPVRIPVEINGHRYEEQHVDGGVTSPLFARPPWQGEDGLGGSVTSLFGSDLYVIISGKLFADAESVRPRALAVASSSVTTVMYAQSRDELFKLYTATMLTGMNFRVASLREDYASSFKSTDFDPLEMRRLFEEGRRQILGGTAWRETPPGVEKGEAPSVRSGSKLVVSPDRENIPMVPVVPPQLMGPLRSRINEEGIPTPINPFRQ